MHAIRHCISGLFCGIIVAASVDLIGQMTPGAASVAPKAPPFKNAWSYGNVGPEKA